MGSKADGHARTIETQQRLSARAGLMPVIAPSAQVRTGLVLFRTKHAADRDWEVIFAMLHRQIRFSGERKRRLLQESSRRFKITAPHDKVRLDSRAPQRALLFEKGIHPAS